MFPLPPERPSPSRVLFCQIFDLEFDSFSSFQVPVAQTKKVSRSVSRAERREMCWAFLNLNLIQLRRNFPVWFRLKMAFWVEFAFAFTLSVHNLWLRLRLDAWWRGTFAFSRPPTWRNQWSETRQRTDGISHKLSSHGTGETFAIIPSSQ